MIEAERRQLALADGAVDTAAWLAARTGAAESTARARARVAATLEQLPDAGQALADGSLTSDHVAALGRAIDEAGADAVRRDAAALLEWASQSSARSFARRLRRWVLRQDDRVGRSAEQRAQRRRSVRLGDDPVAGSGRLVAELPVDEHAIVTNVLWSLVREQWRAEKGEDSTVDTEDPTIPQRLADALVEMARRAAGVGVEGRNRSRPALVVTIDADTLMGRLDAAGLARLADGTPVPVELARRVACEAGIYPTVLDGASQPLDVGREKRLATHYQRMAMLGRSPTCEWPGCSTPASWCQVHHLDPWEAGGPTDIDNLAFLCNGHHHLAHEGGWQVERRPDGFIEVHPPPPVTGSDHQPCTPAEPPSPRPHPRPTPQHQACAA